MKYENFGPVLLLESAGKVLIVFYFVAKSSSLYFWKKSLWNNNSIIKHL